MASELYQGYKTLKIFACGFAGDAIDRVNQLISEVIDIFSCSRSFDFEGFSYVTYG